MTNDAIRDRESSGTARLGLGIAVACVVLIAMGWIAFRSARANRRWTAFTAQAPAFAKGWVDDVRADRLDAAYRATTPGFRARIDREAFGRWAAEHPELRAGAYTSGYSMSTVTGTIMVGLRGIRFTEAEPRMTYTTTLLPAGKSPRTLSLSILADEAGRPVVDQAEFEPEAAGTP